MFTYLIDLIALNKDSNNDSYFRSYFMIEKRSKVKNSKRRTSKQRCQCSFDTLKHVFLYFKFFLMEALL